METFEAGDAASVAATPRATFFGRSPRLARHAIACASLLLTSAAPAHGSAQWPVVLLRHPFPYQAAVTISSDSHEVDKATGEMSVERFEAIHKLLNTESRIERGSPEWRQLFQDPAIDEGEEWKQGVDGFGLPIGDSITFYYPKSGLFERFDRASQKAVPQFYEGVDYRQIVDGWIHRGWVDTLHTGGPGYVPREAMKQGLAWLSEDPDRRLEVWVDHSFSVTPCSIEPDAALTLLELTSKSLAKVGLKVVAKVGGGDLLVSALRATAGDPLADRIQVRLLRGNAIGSFPAEQRVLGWVLGVAYTTSVGAVLLCLGLRRLRTRRNLLLSGGALLLSMGTLYLIPAHFAQGDNPGSPYYDLDLLKRAGFRYFWLILDTSDYTHVVPQLALPERTWNGRSTFFHTVTVDDGSQLLVFPRNKLGTGGRRSLELLTADGLADLIAGHGTSILMGHLLSDAPTTFSAAALRGLARLRADYRAGKVWVAPSVELLRFEFAHTFLKYSYHLEGKLQVIEIEGIDDPYGDLIPPSPANLAGISFRVRGADAIEVRLAGKVLGSESYERISDGDSVVVRFPTSTPPPGAIR